MYELVKKFVVKREKYIWTFLLRMLNKFFTVQMWSFAVAFFLLKFEISDFPILVIASYILILVGVLVNFTVLAKFKSENKIAVFLLLSLVFYIVGSFYIVDDLGRLIAYSVVNSLFVYQVNIILNNLLEEMYDLKTTYKATVVIESADIAGIMLSSFVFIFVLSRVNLGQYLSLIGLVVALIVVAASYCISKFVNGTKISKEFNLANLRQVKIELKEISRDVILRNVVFVSFIVSFCLVLIEFLFNYQLKKGVDGFALTNVGLLQVFGEFQLLVGFVMIVYLLVVHHRFLDRFGISSGYKIQGLSLLVNAGFALFAVPAFVIRVFGESVAVFHRSSYEAYMYLTHSKYKSNFREYNEAFIVPISQIMGGLFLLILQNFLNENSFVLAIVFLVAFFVVLGLSFRQDYQFKKFILKEIKIVSSVDKFSELLDELHCLGIEDYFEEVGNLFNKKLSSSKKRVLVKSIIERLSLDRIERLVREYQLVDIVREVVEREMKLNNEYFLKLLRKKIKFAKEDEIYFLPDLR